MHFCTLDVLFDVCFVVAFKYIVIFFLYSCVCVKSFLVFTHKFVGVASLNEEERSKVVVVCFVGSLYIVFGSLSLSPSSM